MATTVALVSPLLIGAMGLGAEVGYWSFVQREIQNAADVAAHAAAVRKGLGDDAPAYTGMAQHLVERAGLDISEIAFAVNTPPQAGAFTDQTGAVEVTIARNVPRLFTAMFLDGDVTVNARAVALAVTGADDPFGDLEEPVPAGPCLGNTLGQQNKATTFTPDYDHPTGLKSARFCDGLAVRGRVELGPGIYFIESGSFVLEGRTSAVGPDAVLGDGVVLYLSDGVDLRISGLAEFTLTAPTSGPFEGLLVFGSRWSAETTHQIGGTAQLAHTGMIYTPESHFQIIGTPAWTGELCVAIVAATVTIDGVTDIAICDQQSTVTSVRLVE